MGLVLSHIGVALVVATVLPWVRSNRWWIRIFDFPRLQIAVAIVIVLVGFALFRIELTPPRLALVAALVLSLAWHAYRIFPYTPLAPKEVVAADCAAERRIRLLIANVQMTNRNADAFLALVRDAGPDVLLVAEGDRWWDEKLSTLRSDYPHVMRQPQENTYGLHLFSRLPLEMELRFVVEPDIPSFHGRIRLRSGDWIDFHGVHPRPPQPAQDTAQRDAELVIVGRAAKSVSRPTIVAGDLNDVAWSHTTRLFQRVSGLLDPRRGRGLFPTFNARWPLLRWPLDHLFHSETLALVAIRRLSGFGSDHFPMLIELCYAPSAAAVQEPPAPKPGDAEQVRERIREGFEDQIPDGTDAR